MGGNDATPSCQPRSQSIRKGTMLHLAASRKAKRDIYTHKSYVFREPVFDLVLNLGSWECCSWLIFQLFGGKIEGKVETWSRIQIHNRGSCKHFNLRVNQCNDAKCDLLTIYNQQHIRTGVRACTCNQWRYYGGGGCTPPPPNGGEVEWGGVRPGCRRAPANAMLCSSTR